MPVYEYRCKSCGQEFSKFFKSISSGMDVLCPSCGSHDVARLLSTFHAGAQGAPRRSSSSNQCGSGGFT
ncbi:zinc ribbon domain-containing protein [bacterium]|nr:zinc ribbon domain-containing protein [candidate division CSSED10-310 bacterium]